MNGDKRAFLNNFLMDNIILLGFISLFTDISTEMIRSFFPIYFVFYLRGSAFAYGILSGLSEFTASTLKLLSGIVSDRARKRKPFLALGYTISTISKALLYFPKGYLLGSVFYIGDRVGKGIRTSPRDALISESVEKKRWGFAYGLHRAMDTTGAIIGPLLALILISYITFKDMFIAAAVPGFVAVLFIIWVREKNSFNRVKKKKKIVIKIPSQWKLPFIGISLGGLGTFSYGFMLLLAKGSGFEIKGAISLYLTFNIFYAIFSIPFGKIGDKVGIPITISSGYIIYFFTLLGFFYLPNGPLFYLLFVFYGIYFAAVDGNQRAMMSTLSGKEGRGSIQGTFGAVWGISLLTGNIIAGYLFSLSPKLPFIYGAFLSAAASITLFLYSKQRRTNKVQ